MADTITLTKETCLLQQNRIDLIRSLQEIGFTQVDDNTPMSELAKYIKWAGGLLDVRLATFAKATGRHRYWTYEEWTGQSAQTRSTYIQMGLVIRAERQAFIIAKEDATTDGGNSAFWATANHDIPGLTNYNGDPKIFEDFDGEANTDLILAYAEKSGVDHPAARWARAYRCCSPADGGVEDPTKWSLPSEAQLWLVHKYLKQINETLTMFNMRKFESRIYYSSTELEYNYAWVMRLDVYYGTNSAKHTNQNYILPVAKVQEEAL